MMQFYFEKYAFNVVCFGDINTIVAVSQIVLIMQEEFSFADNLKGQKTSVQKRKYF